VVTDQGRILGRIYCGSDLLVAECLRTGVWAGLDPAELAAVVSSVLGESRRPAPGGGALTAGVDAAYRATVRLWREVSDAECRHGLPAGPEPDPVAMRAIHRWARGDGVSAALREAAESDLSAGDLVRRYLRTLDLLGQIGRGGHPVEPAGFTAAGYPQRSPVR
jgi:ATP-dependent RNA helicase HelY